MLVYKYVFIKSAKSKKILTDKLIIIKAMLIKLLIFYYNMLKQNNKKDFQNIKFKLFIVCNTLTPVFQTFIFLWFFFKLNSYISSFYLYICLQNAYFISNLLILQYI